MAASDPENEAGELKQELDAAYEAISMHSRRRNKKPITGRKRQMFIRTFLTTRAFDAYPLLHADEYEDINGYDLRMPKKGTLVGQVLLDTVRNEIQRAAERASVSVNASSVAALLLGSGDDDLSCNVEQLKAPQLSVARLTAHVEALGYNFPRPLVVSIASRAFLLLLTVATHRKKRRSRR